MLASFHKVILHNLNKEVNLWYNALDDSYILYSPLYCFVLFSCFHFTLWIIKSHLGICMTEMSLWSLSSQVLTVDYSSCASSCTSCYIWLNIVEATKNTIRTKRCICHKKQFEKNSAESSDTEIMILCSYLWLWLCSLVSY